MAKNSLINVIIWDEYSNQVVNRMNNPKHQGKLQKKEQRVKMQNFYRCRFWS